MPDDVKDANTQEPQDTKPQDTRPSEQIDWEGRARSAENALRHESSLRTEAEKKASKLEQAQQEAADKKLAEDGKWQDLATQREQRIKELEAQMTEDRIRSAVLTEATKAGIVDPEAAYLLADVSTIQIGDSGQVTGVSEVITALIKARPYLSAAPGQVRAPNIGGGAGVITSPGRTMTLTAEEEETARKMGLTPEQYLKHKTSTPAAMPGQSDDRRV